MGSSRVISIEDEGKNPIQTKMKRNGNGEKHKERKGNHKIGKTKKG